MPKPLVPVRGRPLLAHLLEMLAAQGVRRSVLCVGYLADQIERFALEQRRSDWTLTCVNSGDASMTDRILDARPHVPGPFLVCYGDSLANVRLADLIAHNLATGADATLTVHPMRSPFGVVRFDETTRVTGFDEKPQLPYWINIGFLLCRPAAFEGLRRGSDMVAFLSALAASGRLTAYRHQGRHITVNDERDRATAEAEMPEFLTVLDGSAS